MRFNINRNNPASKRVVGMVRQTQLITTFGCGSIVDLPKHSVIIAGTDFWKNSDDETYKIQEVNLQGLLGVDYFVKPRIDEGSGNNIFLKSRDIPAFRFPEVLICAKCGKIAHYKKFKRGRKMLCPKCNSYNLLPSRFVAACENGHLEDFPYSWWAHYGNPENCKSDNPDDNLYLRYSMETGGLDSIIIYCRSCRTGRSMKGSFSESALKGYKCNGNRPWLRDNDQEVCNKTMRTAQRGGTNLYFPVLSSALSIPPWSNRIQKELDKKWSVIGNLNPDDTLMIEHAINSFKIHEICRCSVQDVKEQIYIRMRGQSIKDRKTEKDIVRDEYKAFLEGENDEGDFITREEEVPIFLRSYIEKVILAHKLREVMTLTGFRRIKPGNEEDGNKHGFSPISRKPKNWFPAMELNGEGMFLKLNEERLRKWERRPDVINRIGVIESHMKKSSFKTEKFSPRYILLHTLSHLIIRQLVLQCGYSSSAIKEKIYSTFYIDEAPVDMCGILIYTATPDSEGSLGGLVSEGRNDKLENTFKNMLDTASWCSSDPLCIQSKGQGMDSLNLAACHSCTLLPETSCEARNSYLDRATIVGTIDDGNFGFFGDLLTGGKKNG